ncbi:CHAT domain-containing protein [Streptomyces sp. LX-29]|nr:CHAT domain-containing protein [Streptomyces sp. LX-29]
MKRVAPTNRAGPAGLASRAAACAIELGDPWRAVQLLELGRGVTLAHALDAPTPLADLWESHPGLAHRLLRLREALDRPAEPDGPGLAGCAGGLENGGPGAAARLEDRHALVEEWARLTDRIRRTPGFAGFQRPPDIVELRATAERLGGPAVIVNVSETRCDALLLDGGEPRIVPLPGLLLSELLDRSADFAAAVRAEAEEEVFGVLEWLWEAVAEPVLTALGLTGRQQRRPSRRERGVERPLPRLWWIPTGPLTALPLHAAGRRAAPGVRADGVLDRAVSSYAPTLGALAHTPAAAPRPASGGGEVEPLVIAVPGGTSGRGEVGRMGEAYGMTAPERSAGSVRSAVSGGTGVAGVPSVSGVTGGTMSDPSRRPGLPRVRREAAALTGRLPGTRVLTGERARREVVLETLYRHRWVHFACRAVSDPDDPSAGRVLLYGEEASGGHHPRPLAVADIARLRLGDEAELAFVSACETARTGEAPGAEPLHLTGALRLAGYAHVVGTLWVADDAVAAGLADDFYAALGEPASAQNAARALHRAVRGAREAHPTAPTRWAAHIHVGA